MKARRFEIVLLLVAVYKSELQCFLPTGLLTRLKLIALLSQTMAEASALDHPVLAIDTTILQAVLNDLNSHLIQDIVS